MPLPLTVTYFSKIPTGFAFLVPAYLGSAGKMAVKRVCVCANYRVNFTLCLSEKLGKIHVLLSNSV